MLAASAISRLCASAMTLSTFEEDIEADAIDAAMSFPNFMNAAYR